MSPETNIAPPINRDELAHIANNPYLTHPPRTEFIFDPANPPLTTRENPITGEEEFRPVDDTDIARAVTAQAVEDESRYVGVPPAERVRDRTEKAEHAAEALTLQDEASRLVEERIADQGIDESRTVRRQIKTKQFQQSATQHGVKVRKHWRRAKSEDVVTPSTFEKRFSNPMPAGEIFEDDGSGNTEGYIVFAEERGIVPSRTDAPRHNPTGRKGGDKDIAGLPEEERKRVLLSLQKDFEDTDVVVWNGVMIYRGKPPENFDEPINIDELELTGTFQSAHFTKGEGEAIRDFIADPSNANKRLFAANAILPQQDMAEQLEQISGLAQYAEQYKAELAELEEAAREQERLRQEAVRNAEREAAQSPAPSGPPPGTPHSPPWA